MGISHLNLTPSQVWLMPFGLLLDLVECWKQDTGRAKPFKPVTIDDVIPPGI